MSRLESPRLAAALLALVCATAAFGAMAPVHNPDLGWHLALGRWIAEHGAVPRTEPFTHTAYGAPMVAHQWLSQLLYHEVVRASGVLALRWLHAGLAVLVLWIVWRMLRREGVAAPLAVLGVLVYATVAQGRFQVRPQMVNLVALAALYGGVFVARPRLGAAQLAGAFGACALWANLYSGAVLFPLLVAIYAVAEIVQQRAGWRAPRPDDLGGGDPRRLLALAAAVSLGVLATPHGLRLLAYVAETRRVNAGLSTEWLPLVSYWGSPLASPLPIQLWWCVGVAFVLTALATLRRQSLSELAVVAVLAALPLASQRFLDLAFAPVVFVLREVGPLLARRPRAMRAAAAASLAIVAAASGARWLALAAPAQGARAAPFARLERAHDFRDAMFPVEAMTFLDDVPLEGRLFAPNKWGGYVLFRTYDRYPVFVDGRWVTIGERIVRDSARIASRRDDAEALLDAYGVDLLLVPRGWMTDGIRERQGWVPLFLNRNAAVYSRRQPENLQRAAAWYAQQGVPFDPQAGFDERTAVAANPGWARTWRVQRVHLDQFASHGARATAAGRPVAGW